MATGTIEFGMLAAIPDDTNGPEMLIAGTTGGRVYWAFDGGGGTENLYFNFRMPADYSSGNTLNIQWSNSTTQTNNCVWQAQVWAVTPNSDTDDMTGSGTYNTAATVTDAGVGTRQLQDAANTLTMDGAQADDYVSIKFFRDSTDGSDNMTEDAYLYALSFEYTTS